MNQSAAYTFTTDTVRVRSGSGLLIAANMAPNQGNAASVKLYDCTDTITPTNQILTLNTPDGGASINFCPSSPIAFSSGLVAVVSEADATIIHI